MNRNIDPETVSFAASDYRIRAVRLEDRTTMLRAGGVMPWFPHPFPDHFADAWLEHAQSSWASGEHWTLSILDARGDYCGTLAFSVMEDGESVESGYWLLPEHEGRGVATRAVTAATAWAIATLQPSRIYAQARAANVASCRVLEKAGFAEIEPRDEYRQFELRAPRRQPGDG